MKGLWWMGLIVVVTLLGGCIPERVVWSPDGRRAAVIGDDGLRVCDPDGKLSPPLVPKVSCVDWFPDSARVAVIREIDLKTFKEAEEVFPSEAKTAIATSAAALKAVLAFNGNWDQLQNALPDKVAKEATWENERYAILATLYVREHDAEQIKAAYGEHWQAFADMEFPIAVAQVFDVGNPARATEGVILRAAMRSGGDQLLGLRVSPTGRAVAVTVGNWDDQSYKIMVADPQTRAENLDLGFGAAFPDWMPDGDTLVFIRPQNQSRPLRNQADVQFGTLSAVSVFDESTRRIFTSDQTLPPTEDLAGVPFAGALRVRVARDGRIFFCSVEVTLPATAKDLPSRPNIFFLDPGKQSVVTRVIPHATETSANLGDCASFFEVSPDGGHIAIPFEDGRVSVLDVATGDVEVATIGTADWSKFAGQGAKLTSVPTWRSAKELTFVQPNADGSKLEVVSYTLGEKGLGGETRVLSGDWPAAVENEWLLPTAPATQPATASAPTTKPMK